MSFGPMLICVCVLVGVACVREVLVDIACSVVLYVRAIVTGHGMNISSRLFREDVLFNLLS